jgi:hypothetical protein
MNSSDEFQCRFRALPRSITVRHAAALALVGWYLMVPPLTTSTAGRTLVNSSAPLTAWLTIASYDTARECNAVWTDTLRTRTAIVAALGEKSSPFVKGGAVAAARCIASDDPRLKGK